tara:strand:+ start:2281 stop:2463 length:183 start_codon:yes stop_codon:yes gene_type:complete
MDWDLELRNQELESMIIVYQEHIDQLEVENEELKKEVVFLKQQLEIKTMGLPNEPEDSGT